MSVLDTSSVKHSWASLFERNPGIRPLCLCLGLAFLRVPSLNEDYGEDAALLLSEFVENQRLTARIEEREKIPGLFLIGYPLRLLTLRKQSLLEDEMIFLSIYIYIYIY